MGNSANRWGIALLITAMISAAGLCVPALKGQALALDEHVSYFCSGAPGVWELWKRCDEVAVLPPLSHLIERGTLAVGGHSESVFRLPSLLAYVLAVPAAWWAARPWGGPLAAGLAALIVAWHPGTLDEVRFARCYGLVLLLASLSTGCVLRWTVDRRWLAAWGVTAAALCWTHYLAVPLVAAQAVLILVCLWRPLPGQNAAGISTMLAITAVGLSCAPLGPALLRLSEWSGEIDFQRTPTTLTAAFGANWTLPALGAVAMAGVWRRTRRNPVHPPAGADLRRRASIGWALFLWALFLWVGPLAVIGTMAWMGSPMLASPRYRVMVTGPSAIVLGLMLSRAFVPPVATAFAVGLLVFSTMLMGTSPTVAGRLENAVEAEWKRAGLEMRPRLHDSKVLVFTQSGLSEGLILSVMGSSDRFRKYAACRLGAFYTGSERALPIPLLWDGTGWLRDDYRKRLDAEDIRQAWIVGANDTDLNAESVVVFARFLELSGFQKTAEETRPGISVLRFEIPGTGPAH